MTWMDAVTVVSLVISLLAFWIALKALQFDVSIERLPEHEPRFKVVNSTVVSADEFHRELADLAEAEGADLEQLSQHVDERMNGFELQLEALRGRQDAVEDTVMELFQPRQARVVVTGTVPIVGES